ncbi:MAG TPA: anthranilate synthase component II [Succinivibrionaceae bacterium]|nr:anthranilate synthase component II [Succinivibrionaceae bacterium]
MTDSIIFIDNFDSFSYNLVDELKVLGYRVKVFRNDTDIRVISRELEKLSEGNSTPALVLSPGPSRPEDANNLLGYIDENLGRYPILGICLGHQALGLALGGSVVKAPSIVHGKSSEITHTGKGAFAGLPNPLRVARYHSLIVRDLPKTVEVTASYNDICMALYEPRLKAIGFQFHPESILSTYGRVLLKQALEQLKSEKAL